MVDRNRHGMDRKTQIISAAIPLFLEMGVDISTAKIAKAAGVANGTLFNAFATKQILIDEIYLLAKSGMNSVFKPHLNKPFNRDIFHDVWVDYLAWGRREPELRKIMHLLLESGLASEAAKAEAEKLSAPATSWLAQAFADGKLRGPNIIFVAKIFFTHLDLVIDQELNGEDQELAFDMICKNIGVSHD